MTKLPIQNQGFRLDLNLQESFDDDAAWDNLYNPGISRDIATLVNNLRNTSLLGPNNNPPTSISLTTNETNDINYGVNNVTTIAPHFFTFTKSNGELTDTVFTNDDIIQVNEEITFNIGDTENGNGSGTVGSLATETLVPNRDYYVCSSNSRDSFKISTTTYGDAVGVSTIPIISVNSNGGSFTSTFGFIRKDAVLAPNLSAFIRPEILDDEFSFLGDSGINASFINNLNTYEYSELLIEDKYKTDKDISTNRDVKYEGSVRVKDPANYNISQTALNATKEYDNKTPDSPGIFIGDTRAFSTDNNPWEKDDSLFSTKSHADEFKIGDLEFGGVTNSDGVITAGKIKIDGLDVDGTEIVDITDSNSNFGTYFDENYNGTVVVYKFPMIINGETFYILVEKE